MSQQAVEAKPRRNVELVLLILALGVGIGALAMTNVDKKQAVDAGFWIQSATLTALAAAFHIVLRFRARYADPVILPIVVALNGLGIAMIRRLDASTGSSAGTNQMTWTIVSVLVAGTVLWLLKDHRILRRYTFISLAVSGALLILPLVPGISAGDINGANVWIRLGPLQFQPGEIVKITLAIFFAGYLSSNRDLILLAGRKFGRLQFPRVKDTGPMITAWAASVAVLVFQHDLGMSILLFGLFLVMIYVATSRASWLVLGLVLIVLGGYAAAKIFSHVGLRIDAWANAFDPQVFTRFPGGSAQIVQGLFGMADGGLIGKGLGLGSPDLVPFANSDMIIASMGEELGLVGLFAIVLLYLLLFTRGFRAALGIRDAFGKLLACGLSFSMALQCFIIIGGVTRLIPLTGLTTPFLSAGGSSLLANWIIVALLLRISDAARRPQAVAHRAEQVAA
ncbi:MULTISPECIES: FtsW/RodA/SpoVE family cell cycle protein [Arthrobacter]|uniref:FtsW/RodA/SpoVE family cell cycle protein n=1 Tax=Arthrobacter terricola TaxID=2547396 RepID=A0A4R5KPY3_9MICC|nr:MULTISPECIES: FtsW/RodA/SpoVE family cell cycle protein [Arthrobacter]MBT8160859.1 FtsW/RodA/SpoVE family cell cycle protein [Arthrobacter sp. GN70]TDF97382.1 FtsW/RodA/SpoVE family cell cycle protein [Arthrobacter terricola]